MVFASTFSWLLFFSLESKWRQFPLKLRSSNEPEISASNKPHSCFSKHRLIPKQAYIRLGFPRDRPNRLYVCMPSVCWKGREHRNCSVQEAGHFRLKSQLAAKNPPWRAIGIGSMLESWRVGNRCQWRIKTAMTDVCLGKKGRQVQAHGCNFLPFCFFGLPVGRCWPPWGWVLPYRWKHSPQTPTKSVSWVILNSVKLTSETSHRHTVSSNGSHPVGLSLPSGWWRIIHPEYNSLHYNLQQ